MSEVEKFTKKRQKDIRSIEERTLKVTDPRGNDVETWFLPICGAVVVRSHCSLTNSNRFALLMGADLRYVCFTYEDLWDFILKNWS